MIIAHASDTHDHPALIRGVADVECDVILLTGDILSNRGRINGEQRIVPHLEYRYQASWARRAAKKWAPAFRGRDVVYVDGNHDFYDGLGKWLIHYGHPAERLHHISDETPSVVVQGVKFAGFRQVTFMIGEWVGEEHDLAPHVERALAEDPDILVTHTPPAGILDGSPDCSSGSAALMSALAYRPHGISHHFFGHAHWHGGDTDEQLGIKFYNGACHLKVHEIELK